MRFARSATLSSVVLRESSVASRVNPYLLVLNPPPPIPFSRPAWEWCGGVAPASAAAGPDTDRSPAWCTALGLTEQQAADHGRAERRAVRSRRHGPASAAGRSAARHRRHHDRAEAQQARLADRVQRRLAVAAFGGDGEVHHHDAVLLHDADQQDHADQRDTDRS